MYRLEVFSRGASLPNHCEHVGSAATAMTRIAALLSEHAECEKILVSFGGERLFAVDCAGNRLDV